MNGMNLIPGVSVQDFCAKAQATCGLGGANQYTNSGSCMARYTAYTDTQKSCVSYHVCAASTVMPNGTTIHCPHIGAVTTGPSNLCGTPTTPAP